MKCLILCAGRGTRLGLKNTPKCMVKVNKKPVLEHLVNHLNKYGITEIIINISGHSDYIKIFRYFGTRLLYFYEPTLMGEHGTELSLQPWLGDEYIVMNGDTLTDVNIYDLTKYKISRGFYKNGRYAGTKYINTTEKSFYHWHSDSYYFDIGTPKKLAKARRFYARNS